jgi:exopolysaccharide biosynthesis protein
LWNTTAAIGGSPLLIRNGVIQITDAEELIDINNNSARPRSAIGFNGSGIVLLLAVEGDNPPNYPGVNLATLAALLQALGCQGAINLDGGGSTALVVNNTATVRAGGNGVERAVMSAVLIKRR